MTCPHLSLLNCKVRVMGISAASGAWGRASGPTQLEVPLYPVPREVAVITPAARSFCQRPFATVALRGEGEWHLPVREVLKARPCHPPQASVVVGSRQQSQKRDRDTPTWSCQDLCPTHWRLHPPGPCWWPLLLHWCLATHPHYRWLRPPRRRGSGPIVGSTASNSTLPEINKEARDVFF